jgi:hypothetical protein
MFSKVFARVARRVFSTKTSIVANAALTHSAPARSVQCSSTRSGFALLASASAAKSNVPVPNEEAYGWVDREAQVSVNGLGGWMLFGFG